MKKEQLQQNEPLRETAVSGSLRVKLTAYECYKKRIDENLTDEQFKQLLIDNEIIIEKPCPNCKEDKEVCKCIENICFKCGYSVGNITFSVCDDCWHK